MQYIAALDYDHLDNGMFLTALARSISLQQGTRPIIIHGDSSYTERIMQTGVMREEAKIRSIKDLNHRLIALFADEGVSAVGLNGYQRKLITQKEDKLSLDTSFIENLPVGPVLLISTLVWNIDTASPSPIKLARMVSFLQDELNAKSVFAFTQADKDEIIINKKPDEMRWNNLSSAFVKKNLPEEFQDYQQPLYLSTAREFSNLPEKKHSVLIR